jgi:hypothetical protein
MIFFVENELNFDKSIFMVLIEFGLRRTSDSVNYRSEVSDYN